MGNLRSSNLFTFLEELHHWYNKGRDDFFVPIFDDLDEPGKMFVLYKAFNEGVNEKLDDRLMELGYEDLLLQTLLLKKEEVDVERDRVQEKFEKKSKNKEELYRKLNNLDTYTQLLTLSLNLDLEYFRLKTKIDIFE